MTLIVETPRPASRATDTMHATVFHGPNDIRVESVPKPHAGVGEAVVRVTTTTICGTDIHILKGEYPVRPGLIIGHEPVGVIDELGPGVIGYEVGQRVLVPAITPCGQCRACLSGNLSQCGHGGGYEAMGGWRFGNTINGGQAEYILVPSAQANLTLIPDDVTDEQVVLLSDIASTGFSGPESGGVKIGDAVVVFALGPIGLCAVAGAKLMGASLIIGVDSDPVRLEMPYDAFAAGLGGHRIVTTLCPGGKERMRRLIATVQSGRFDPLPLITHRFALDDIVEAYDLFSSRRDGVLKVAIRP